MCLICIGCNGRHIYHVKVYITEYSVVIKRHSNVITIWRTSAIEVTALLKNLHPDMKGVQEKDSIMGARGRF